MTMTEVAGIDQPFETLFATDDARWQAARERDGRADGVFYYAVTSTGIYCRPTCPARKPLRRNALFFVSCAAAEAAGFRPCKICRPTLAARPTLAPGLAVRSA